MAIEIPKEVIKTSFSPGPNDVTYDTLELYFTKDGRLISDSLPIRIYRIGDEKKIFPLEDNADFNAGEKVEFEAVYFDLKIPGKSGKESAELKLRISNIDRSIYERIIEAKQEREFIELVYRRYNEVDGELFFAYPDRFQLSSVDVTNKWLTGSVVNVNLHNRKILSHVYTYTDYPTLRAK